MFSRWKRTQNVDHEVVSVHRLTNKPEQAWDEIKVKQTYQRLVPTSHLTPINPDCIRFVCFSDTHNQTTKECMVDFPEGDVFLHTGDFTMIGAAKEVVKFNQWLGTLPYKRKIVIAGNHDLLFDDALVHKEKTIGGTIISRRHLSLTESEQLIKDMNVSHVAELLTNCIYLKDSNTNVCGINIYGSPWQPWFGGWAFNLPRGQQCLNMWNLIPNDTDILMTHGPPIGHGDLVYDGLRAGCVELLTTIQKRVKPKYHIFGHIHEDPGVTTDGHTIFINASTCDLRYKPTQKAIIFDFPIPEGHTKAEIIDGDVDNIHFVEDMEVEDS